MAPEQNDDTTTEQPTKRMTVAEAAAAAQQALSLATAAQQNSAASLRVAQGADDMAAAMSEKLTGLATQLTELREAGEVSPVAATLEEDALSDQLEGMVDRKVAAMFEDAQLTPARLAGLTREFDDLRQHVEQHGTHVERAVLDRVVEQAEQRLSRTEPTNRHTPIAEVVFGKKPVPGVHAKVLDLMRMVTYIGKEKQANLGAGGRFKFRGIDDAMDAVGHAMREVGLTLKTEVLGTEYAHNPVTKTNDRGETSTVLWTTAMITMRYTFVDPADASEHPFEMVGEGRDASDKGSSKAASMAAKYGLFQALMIPVNGLDDSDNESPQVVQPYQSPNLPANASPQQPVGPAHTDPPATPDQQATDVSKHQRAQDALKALRATAGDPTVPVAQRQAKVAAIWEHAQREGLGGIELEGASIRGHVIAIQRTLNPNANADD